MPEGRSVSIQGRQGSSMRRWGSNRPGRGHAGTLTWLVQRLGESEASHRWVPRPWPRIQPPIDLLAGVPHGTFVECFADPERDPMWQSVWANRPPVENGMLTVS